MLPGASSSRSWSNSSTSTICLTHGELQVEQSSLRMSPRLVDWQLKFWILATAKSILASRSRHGVRNQQGCRSCLLDHWRLGVDVDILEPT